MLTVKNIRVRSFSTEYSHVVWQIEPTAETLADYDFYVYRSGGQAGPYTVVGGPLVDQYIWRDSRARDGQLWAPYYYRILVVHRATAAQQMYGARSPQEVSEGLDPGGVSRDPEPPFDAKEAIYRMRLLLKTHGRDIFLFQRRAFGQKCPECWDAVKSTRRMSHCQTCFDTGFVSGFFRPIATRVMNARNPVKADALTDVSRRQTVEKSFRFSAYPEIKPRDLIVDSTNNRWRANIIDPSHRGDTLVSQLVTCSRIPKPDIEYEVPVRGIDPVRVEFDAELNRKPAYNLESLMSLRNKAYPLEV